MPGVSLKLNAAKNQTAAISRLSHRPMTRSFISSGSTFEAEIGYSRAVGWGSKNLTLTPIFSNNFAR
jgi:hypothetical protein